MIYKENTIQELVNTNFAYQLLSEKLAITSSDHSKTFAQVCLEKNLSTSLVETLIKVYDTAYEFPYAELNQLSINQLIHYLQTSHTFYLSKKLPEIEQTIAQVFKTCHESDPLFPYLCSFFTEYRNKLESHIRYEEEKLFPYINKLVEAAESGKGKSELFNELHSFSTSVFIKQHSNIEEDLQHLRKTILKHSSGHKLPLPYRIFLNQLHYFEIELNNHALIEDEVLIAKALALEMSLLKEQSA